MFGTEEPTAQGLVKEGSQATFMEDVVEASRTVPVLAYFTASWCGPCKTLGPALEKAVQAKGGSVRAVKIDVDANRTIAAQMGIQSVPTVFAFVDGKPVDGFMGAKPPSEIDSFIASIVKMSGGNTVEESLESAEELIEQGAILEAVQILTSILSEDRENAAAYAGLIRCHMLLDDLTSAEAMLNSAPESIKNSGEISAERSRFDLIQQAKEAGPIDKFRAALERDAEDHQSRYDLATALHAAGDVGSAIDELLELFRRNRDWNDGAAKDQLLRIFDSLKPSDQIALKGRRRLSSMIFN